MNNVKKILCSIGIVFVSLVLLIPFWYTFLLSFNDYSAMKGLFGSPWVGFNNFASFLNSAYFVRILSNTLVISVLGTVIGAVYVFVSSLAIGSGKNSLIKGILTAVFAIPAIIPVSLFAAVLPKELLLAPSFLLKLSVSAIDGLRMAGLVVSIAFFIKNDVLKESIKCMLLFLAIRLIFSLSTDVTVISSVYNPLTYEALDVLSSYIYRTGLMNNGFSNAAAVHIVKTALQFVPAVLACVILIVIGKNKSENAFSSNDSFMPATVAAVIPAMILITVIITGGSLLPAVFNVTVITGYINEFLISFISAFFVAIISVSLAIAARNSGAIGIVALSVLCLTGNSIVGKYMMIRSFGIYGTLVGVIFCNFSMISVLALILTFATNHERSIAKDVSAFIIGFIMMFSRFWGDYFSPMMMLRDRDTYPLSLLLREIAMGAEAANTGILFSTLPYILIPVIVVCAGFVISAAVKKD